VYIYCTVHHEQGSGGSHVEGGEASVLFPAVDGVGAPSTHADPRAGDQVVLWFGQANRWWEAVIGMGA
jgi:hypothetical protein